MEKNHEKFDKNNNQEKNSNKIKEEKNPKKYYIIKKSKIFKKNKEFNDNDNNNELSNNPKTLLIKKNEINKNKKNYNNIINKFKIIKKKIKKDKNFGKSFKSQNKIKNRKRYYSKFYNANKNILFLLLISYLIINIIILIFNIYFLFKQKINQFLLKEKDYIVTTFKNVDFFSLNMIIKTFNDISSYLNSKLNTNKNIIQSINQNIENKKIINLYTIGSLTDHYKRKLRNSIIEGLTDKYIFNFTKHNPDYLIYDVLSCSFIKHKYNNSIKIAFYNENQIPDFNKADYAIAFQNINYLDRYFRRTTLIGILEKRYLNVKNEDFIRERNEVLNSKMRTKFCAAVISNNYSTDGFRLKFIKELSKYKKVDMGGRVKNNVGGAVQDKKLFLSSYKFSIAMENSEGDGYISEKILDSFISGTIPIYYGDYMIDEYINPKALILIRNEKDMYEKIEYIKKIDNDDNLYRSILKEDLFINNNILEISRKEKIEFFDNIFKQEKDKAKRIDNYHFNINN